jgi:hypothetical protein
LWISESSVAVAVIEGYMATAARTFAVKPGDAMTIEMRSIPVDTQISLVDMGDKTLMIRSHTLKPNLVMNPDALLLLQTAAYRAMGLFPSVHSRASLLQSWSSHDRALIVL